MLEIKDISVKLGDFALKNLSMSVDAGEYVVILGMSGVGKTVLLEIMAGLLLPDQGQVIMNDVEITRQKIQNRPIRLVYQDQALFPHLSVRKNLAYGLQSQHVEKGTIADSVTTVARQLSIDRLLDRMPETLSGGEAQRVALGRALVTKPDLLLLDEPLSALDPQARGDLQSLLRELHRQKQTIVHVTHDYEEAVALATRIVLLDEGSVAQTGTPREIFAKPKTKFVARFMGIRNFVEGNLTSAMERGGEVALFQENGINVEIMTNQPSGPGFCVIRAEDITLSDHQDQTSALNQYEGKIVDIIPSTTGVEVLVDTGIVFTALITSRSVSTLGLTIGKTVFISMKATAIKFIQSNR